MIIKWCQYIATLLLLFGVSKAGREDGHIVSKQSEEGSVGEPSPPQKQHFVERENFAPHISRPLHVQKQELLKVIFEKSWVPFEESFPEAGTKEIPRNVPALTELEFPKTEPKKAGMRRVELRKIDPTNTQQQFKEIPAIEVDSVEYDSGVKPHEYKVPRAQTAGLQLNSLIFKSRIEAINVQRIVKHPQNLEAYLRLTRPDGFSYFIEKFHRNFSSTEERETRRLLFQRRVMKVKGHNEQPGQHYIQGINLFSDLDDDEFKRTILMMDTNLASSMEHLGFVKRSPADSPSDIDHFRASLPKQHVDHRLGPHSPLSPVQNQGYCGSCYAFAATAVIEAMVSLKTGQPPQKLSDQQILDCDTQNFGCSGGEPHTVLRVIAKSGLFSEVDYPYRAKMGRCQASQLKDRIRYPKHEISEIAFEFGSEVNLLEAVMEHPVVVAVDASEWRDYAGGVLSANPIKRFLPGDLNHAVVAIGFDLAAPERYYIIRNSWGPLWGENGHARIQIGLGAFGMGLYSTWPILDTKENQ